MFKRVNKIRKNNKTLVFSSPSFERGTVIFLVLCAEAKQVGSSSSSSLLTAFIEVLLCAHLRVRPQRHPWPQVAETQPGYTCGLDGVPEMRPLESHPSSHNNHTMSCTQQKVSKHFSESPFYRFIYSSFIHLFT